MVDMCKILPAKRPRQLALNFEIVEILAVRQKIEDEDLHR